jgi:apolipoprotein N-acyltransferase
MLVQPSIPQTLIWDASSDAQRFQDLLQFTEQSLTNQAEVLIWPESAVPKMVRYDTNIFEAITGLARRHHLWMIIGSDDAEPRRNATRREEADYFNSSFLISPQGKLVDRYVKRSLVIFGEYVPLQGWLPFLKYFTPIQGGFTPGTRVAPFNLTTLQAQTAVLICFEDVFPNVAREDVNPETDFLVNITNDGWFGQGAAQWQQGVSGLFRAVENGVPLIRCCNNGLTCWIDGKGRLRQILRDERGTIYGSGVLNAEIPIGAPGESHPLTFYTRHGDWFGWTCVVLACLALARRVAALVQSEKNETRAGAGGY